jgi:hypothetical protein
MRHLQYTAVVCALATLSVAAACTPVSDPLPADVFVTMTLDRTSLRTGDTLLIKVVGMNTSNATMEVPSYPCLASLKVLKEQGEAVAFGDPINCEKPLFPPIVLAPRDTWGDTVRIIHPAVGVFSIRGGLPLTLGSGSYIYSEVATVTVRP